MIMRALSVVTILILVFVYAGHTQGVSTTARYYYENDSLFTQQSEIRINDKSNIDDKWNHLTINSDSRINLLLAIQQEESIRKGGIDGYRVQIYQGNKDEAFQIKSMFMSQYPDYKVYILFQTPDFRVRIGNFRTRSEAINLKYKIIRSFPNLFIVEDIINISDIDQ